MTMRKTIAAASAARLISKADPDAPALVAIGRDAVAIRAGTVFGGRRFEVETPVEIKGALVVGADYGVTVSAGRARAWQAGGIPDGDDVLGGFHYAPGGNALARSGGDDMPAINPCSLWDVAFRPACPDPRGMALVDKPGGRFWCDIYLTGQDCYLSGTSRYGVTIADGDSCPIDGATSERFPRFDYAAAVAAIAAHGKGLLGLDEFPAAAFGVTEKTSCKRDPKTTGLDAPRTSRFGIMQATGNMWIWGHDGDPDTPRASLFGGSWLSDGYAGSRSALVACRWPGISGNFGARGRSDHLQPAPRRDSGDVRKGASR
ncbi:hypothetical protein SAMN05216337_1001219 [Bradyrhizobium brasilense]|uniref:Major tropism determinant second domain-containing protein n=1 Tax=Bradyrhizobium brasilense TaxID=1419277 RepID=A0A1G6IQD2_9BRAD|nr:hypothetical protein [Bradyrhizobium brasilense]SDC08643.1 hypothetical protein SAMN05216337_1001219 [Bradyrhizobium brasilense]